MSFRKKAPSLREITKISLHKPQKHQLDNGIPVFEVNMGTQALLKLEIIFFAGRWYENKPLVARATARLLKEGTKHKTSAQIAEMIDFYGGSLKVVGNLDTASITLFCLSKHFETLLALVHELLTEPIFPQKEMDSYTRTAKMNLEIEQSKNDIVAYREVTAAMYGDKHPYGYNSTPNDYDLLSREDLLEHFNQNYHAANCKIIISGQTSDVHLKQINELFGKSFSLGEKRSVQHPLNPYKQRKIQLKIPNSVQTAIRIGRVLPSRKHPDYFGVLVLNTLLGGYFGSRLMRNIREEKGYTYGIHSSIDNMLNGNYFYIGTEVGLDVTKPTLKEIYKELKCLREEPAGQEELEKLRNYLLGTILTSMDGPFNISRMVKTLVLEELDATYFQRFIDTIKTIQPEQLQALANQYFQEEDLSLIHI